MEREPKPPVDDRIARRGVQPLSRAALLAALAATFAAAGCLDTAVVTPAQFDCPDGNCPLGYVCGQDGLCRAAPSAASSAGSGATGATAGGSSGGSGGTTAGTVGSSGSSGAASSSSGGSGSSGGGSTGAALSDFGGEWDTSFAHVSLAQDGGTVTGQYRDWGYSYLDPTNAGTISGAVVGNAFTGTFQDMQRDAPQSLGWALSEGQLQGSYQAGSGQPKYPWCGVAAGRGTALPFGCGWSGAFVTDDTGDIGVNLEQVADEVSGSYTGGAISGGVVTGLHVNLQYAKTGATFFGRFSWWMTPDGTQFSGNYVVSGDGANTASCGYRSLTPAGTLPNPCLGGGGFYDGTWFTNFGTVTLSQPAPSYNPVSGVWFGWGSQREYRIDGGASGPAAGGPPSAYSLTWTDDSPLGGAVNMVTAPNDLSNGLQGRAAVDGTTPWCGVSYGVNPFVAMPLPDAGKTGNLSPGCGLTSSQWSLWQPSPADPSPPPEAATLVQTRGSVTGFTNPPYGFELVGTLAFTGSSDAGSAAGALGTLVTGNWIDVPDGGNGAFTFYPDSQDQTFTGDFTSAGATGAWCGSLSGSLPSPCGQ